MESCGFEIQDVEALRRHYARTCRLRHDRLTARRAEAIALVGPERYRMRVAHRAGVTVGFEYGPLHVCQTVDQAGRSRLLAAADARGFGP